MRPAPILGCKQAVATTRGNFGGRGSGAILFYPLGNSVRFWDFGLLLGAVWLRHSLRPTGLVLGWCCFAAVFWLRPSPLQGSFTPSTDAHQRRSVGQGSPLTFDHGMGPAENPTLRYRMCRHRWQRMPFKRCYGMQSVTVSPRSTVVHVIHKLWIVKKKQLVTPL